MSIQSHISKVSFVDAFSYTSWSFLGNEWSWHFQRFHVTILQKNEFQYCRKRWEWKRSLRYRLEKGTIIAFRKQVWNSSFERFSWQLAKCRAFLIPIRAVFLSRVCLWFSSPRSTSWTPGILLFNRRHIDCLPTETAWWSVPNRLRATVCYPMLTNLENDCNNYNNS